MFIIWLGHDLVRGHHDIKHIIAMFYVIYRQPLPLLLLPVYYIKHSVSYYYNVYSTWVSHPPRYIRERFLEAISIEDCDLKWPYTVRPCPLTGLGRGDLSHSSEVSFVTNGNHRNLIQGGTVIILWANLRITCTCA